MKRLTVFLKLVLCLMVILSLSVQSDEPRGVKIVIRDKSGEQVGLYENSYALVIGISDYTNGWPDLPGVKKDVVLVKEALEKHGADPSTAHDLVGFRCVSQD